MTIPPLPAPLNGASTVWTASSLHVLNGKEDGPAFDPVTRRWTASAGGPAPPSTEVQLDIREGAGILRAESADSSLPTSRGAALEPGRIMAKSFALALHVFDGARVRFDEGDAIVLPSENAPSPRLEYLFVRIKDGIVIWGGLTDHGETNTGAIYDRRTGAWRPTQSANAPTPRLYPATHTWTGSKLIVFGSHYEGRPQADGALLDPADGSWTPLPPGGPQIHVTLDIPIVWTGGRLSFFDSVVGASYDASAGSWRAIGGMRRLPPTYLVRAWPGPNGAVVLAGLVPQHSKDPLYLATYDPRTGAVRELPSPPIRGKEDVHVHFTGNTLIVLGGGTSKLTSQGGGCGGPRRPQDPICDPLPPRYGWTSSSDGAMIRLY